MSFGLVKSAAAGAAASLRLRYTSGHDVAIANWKNRTLFTGDNLDVLRGMNSESVDLIYLARIAHQRSAAPGPQSSSPETGPCREG